MTLDWSHEHMVKPMSVQLTSGRWKPQILVEVWLHPQPVSEVSKRLSSEGKQMTKFSLSWAELHL